MRSALAALLLLLPACGDGAPAGPPAPAPYSTHPVVAEAIAALEARVPPLEIPTRPADLAERVAGLVTFLTGASGELREAALEDARALGGAAAAALAARAADALLSEPERASALALLAALDGAPAAEAWLGLAEDPLLPGWVRARAYFELGALGSEDWILPRFLLRLKYEKDHEAFVWLCSALARHGNYSGLERLLLVWAEDPSEVVRAVADERLVEIAAALSVEQAGAIRDAWAAGDPDGLLPPPVRSARWELELWRWIDRLDEFQLRGVDDARFLLSRSVDAAAPLLGAALRDERRKVRVHSAQSLERMGPRGAEAAEALIAALDEPDVAPVAAAALGALGPASAGRTGPALAPRLSPGHAPGLRLAAARALGVVRDPALTGALRAHLGADQLLELRQACAEALALCGQGAEVVALLLEFLEDPRVEATTSENALRHVLAERADAGVEGAAALLAEWDSIEAAAPGEFPTVEATRAASARRAALLRGHLDELSADYKP